MPPPQLENRSRAPGYSSPHPLHLPLPPSPFSALSVPRPLTSALRRRHCLAPQVNMETDAVGDPQVPGRFPLTARPIPSHCPADSPVTARQIGALPLINSEGAEQGGGGCNCRRGVGFPALPKEVCWTCQNRCRLSDCQTIITEWQETVGMAKPSRFGASQSGFVDSRAI